MHVHTLIQRLTLFRSNKHLPRFFLCIYYLTVSYDFTPQIPVCRDDYTTLNNAFKLKSGPGDGPRPLCDMSQFGCVFISTNRNYGCISVKGIAPIFYYVQVCAYLVLRRILYYLNSRLITSNATSRLVITTTQLSRAILQLLEFSPSAKYLIFNSAKSVACSSVANVINVQDLE